MNSATSSCGNGCGLVAALVGVLGFGSFGAPLKCQAINLVDADPYVLQTYKSLLCFLTCWTVLLFGAEFEFTPLGILSGVLWVTGGFCGIFGIRNAGLAISVGTWSSITVLISFAWGIFVFDEEVQSVTYTSIGVLMMIIGFLGMTMISISSKEIQKDLPPASESFLNHSEGVLPVGIGHELTERLLEPDCAMSPETGRESPNQRITDEEILPFSESLSEVVANDVNKSVNRNSVELLGTKFDRKVLGLFGAATDGILGGSNLIPMKFSPSIDRGLDYVISFAIGAIIATLAGWLMRYSFGVYREKSLKIALQKLPSMHLDKILIPGSVSGILWSIGNIGQIVSVTVLGESIGMSIVQSSMIVSGIIGIVWFKEIEGSRNITFWGLSAVFTFFGIIFLSNEHKS